MVTTWWRDIGINYGGQHIGKGISRALKEVDKAVGKEAAAIQERPSTWITVIGTFAFPAAAMFLKLKDPWDKLFILIGGYISTGLWDIIEEAMVAGGGGGGAAYYPTYVAAAPAAPTATASAAEKVY
jgi:hypothetical protein